ncbi:MAG: penicillin-insensitive murein endopeptidase, partial [Deltaproteobacteria bacterium]|nr:penicillin-insensitive murein endopeptidase [Deltaproteobacteria bacterium]
PKKVSTPLVRAVFRERSALRRRIFCNVKVYLIGRLWFPMRAFSITPVLLGLLFSIEGFANKTSADEPSLIRVPVVGPQSRVVETGRAWVYHVVIPWERLAQVAERYGVSEEEIREWNGLPADRHPLRVDMTLRILARKFPPPRNSLTHVVGENESWESVAKRYGRTAAELKLWNVQHARRKLKPDIALQIWMDSSLPGLGSGQKGRLIEPIPVPDGGLSVGRPVKGRLENGVALPPSELYTIRIPHHAYGTSYAVRNIQKAISSFRYQSGFKGEIIISDLSRKGGRRLPPHRSHQAGRDVDIWLPAMPHVRPGKKPDYDEVDWHAAWLLINAFADTGAVKRIYLDRKVFKRLRRASKAFGASWQAYQNLVGGSSLVWHQPGHESHIHVRFRCSAQADRCRD